MLILWSINGNAHFHNTEKIPNLDEKLYPCISHRKQGIQFILLQQKPKYLSLWQKNSFQICIFRFRCVGSFPIDRDNLCPSAIKQLMFLKEHRSLIMLSSGSRHSNDVKGGVALIAKMAKARIMPATYTGPMTLKGPAVNVLDMELETLSISRY